MRKLAYGKIQSLPFDKVGGEWLRLYVDATVGMVMSQMMSEGAGQQCISEKVKALDTAIIIAGAVGREDAIHLIIEILQQAKLPRENSSKATSRVASQSEIMEEDTTARPVKRQRIKGDFSSSTRQRIPVLETPPSISQFNQCERNRPFLLRRYLADADDDNNPYGLGWPAVQQWKSLDHLIGLVGEDRVVPVEIGASYTDATWSQRIVPFRTFLESVGYPGTEPRPPTNVAKEAESPMYLAQYSLLKQFPQLQRDIILPDYVYAAPTAPDSFPGYKPPGNEEEVVVNVWVGAGRGSVTSPPHTVSTA